MTTLTRSTSRTTPAYKDYVNFLGAYKKKEDPAGENFSMSNSSNVDVTDFSKSSCVSFNSYVENTKTKKFNSVKPNLEEKPAKKTEKTEIFIEIQPSKSVSEVTKIFEKKEKSPPAKSINSKIDVFERQISKEKPKLANKPVMASRSPPPKIETKPPEFSKKTEIVSTPPPPPPMNAPIKNTVPVKNVMSASSPPTPPPPPPLPINAQVMNTVPVKSVVSAPIPPPPPMNAPPMNGNVVPVKSVVNAPPPPPLPQAVPKIQATLTKGPQIQVKHSVNNPNGVVSNGIDRNDPMVKKLVYGTLRGLYGAYHDKANDMMATLPKDRVKKSNGVQDIIEKIASSGDLDKLNGRVNPKLDQD